MVVILLEEEISVSSQEAVEFLRPMMPMTSLRFRLNPVWMDVLVASQDLIGYTRM